MLYMPSEETFPFTYVGIDKVSEHIASWLGNIKMQRRNTLLIRLTLEDALIRMYDHLGGDDAGEIRMTTGRNPAGFFIRISIDGDPYNPLGGTRSNADGWSASLINSVGMRPQYAYVGNTNVLRMSFASRGMNPALALLIGIAVGALVGVVGNVVLPDSAQEVVVQTVIEPVFNVWTRLLNAIASPVIFFMVVTTMLNTQKVEEQGGNKMAVVVRYLVMCFTGGVLAVACAVAAFCPSFGQEFVGIADASEAIAGITYIIPNHILEPFFTSNTPQLMLLAFVLGNAIIALGERAKGVSDFVRQMNLACSLVTTWTSALVPIMSGILLALEIWGNQVRMLTQMWAPLLLGLILSFVFFMIWLMGVHRRLGVSRRLIIKKIEKPFWITLREGTLDASYGEVEHSCVMGLGIDETFTSVTLPQGLVLYMPASIIGTLVFTVFAAKNFDVSITLWWCLLASLIDVLLFVATPPVPGANLLAFITLFQLLGIPDAAFLDAMIFDIIFGLYANGANQSLLQLEMALEADHLGLIDREILRSESS